VEVRLWHEFVGYVGLIAAGTSEGPSLFAPAFLCEHSRNECPDLQVYNDGVEVGKPKPETTIRVRPAICDSYPLTFR
jgi:hypothetical protein